MIAAVGSARRLPDLIDVTEPYLNDSSSLSLSDAAKMYCKIAPMTGRRKSTKKLRNPLLPKETKGLVNDLMAFISEPITAGRSDDGA